MGHAIHFVIRLYAWLDGLEWLWRLAVRLSVGIEFFGSGFGKLGRLPGFIQYFRTLGVPFPELLAPFVASVEFVCGTLIVVGVATRPAALMLSGVTKMGAPSARTPQRAMKSRRSRSRHRPGCLTPNRRPSSFSSISGVSCISGAQPRASA